MSIVTLGKVGAPNQRAGLGFHDGVVCPSICSGCSRVLIKVVSRICESNRGFQDIARASPAQFKSARVVSRSKKITLHRTVRETFPGVRDGLLCIPIRTLYCVCCPERSSLFFCPSVLVCLTNLYLDFVFFYNQNLS